MRQREFGGRPHLMRDFLLRYEDERRAEQALFYLERCIGRDEHLEGHLAPRPDLGRSEGRYNSVGAGAYPEPLIAVRRFDHYRAEVVSFPDGEILSEPMTIMEACRLVRELLAS